MKGEDGRYQTVALSPENEANDQLEDSFIDGVSYNEADFASMMKMSDEAAILMAA